MRISPISPAHRPTSPIRFASTDGGAQPPSSDTPVTLTPRQLQKQQLAQQNRDFTEAAVLILKERIAQAVAKKPELAFLKEPLVLSNMLMVSYSPPPALFNKAVTLLSGTEGMQPASAMRKRSFVSNIVGLLQAPINGLKALVWGPVPPPSQAFRFSPGQGLDPGKELSVLVDNGQPAFIASPLIRSR